MGELLCPCLVQGSVGVVYPVRPQEEQPRWRGSSGHLDSAPAGTPEVSVCRAWRLPGGAADLLSWGRSVLAVLGPPGLCLSRGRLDPGLCPGAAVLRSLRCWIHAPAPQPPPRSHRPSPTELLPERRSPLRMEPLPLPEPLRAAPGPPCALQPLGSSAHSPGAQVSVSVPGSPRASPPSWVLLQLPASPFPPGKGGAAPAPPGRGSPVLGTLAPASARLLAGPSPVEACVSLFLFPRLPTLIEARTLLTVAFQLVSL